MRQANKAVQRECFLIPNVEDTLYHMNGATVFLKLDLTQSFHEIELEESSRYITTFVCPKGFYHYKRLMFGINSAPDLHQRIIQQTIQDIPECKNVVDDIIVYAKNQQDHDTTLHALLSRFCQNLFTLNRNKCEFNKSELKFMGHTSSKDGVKPDDSKIKAVQEFQRTTTPAEVRRFLGLVKFCAKYISNFATIAEPLRKFTKKEIKWNWCSVMKGKSNKMRSTN
jgi:hypothetical protein